MNRVVVTGLGVVSPLGIGVETFWEGMLAGKSGIGPIDTFDAANHKTHFAGLVRDFNPEERFGKKEARKMDRFTQFGLAAAEEALADSGLQLEQLDRERLAVYVRLWHWRPANAAG